MYEESYPTLNQDKENLSMLSKNAHYNGSPHTYTSSSIIGCWLLDEKLQ